MPSYPVPAPLPVSHLALILRDLTRRTRADVGALAVADVKHGPVRLVAGTGTETASHVLADSPFAAWTMRTGGSCAGVVELDETAVRYAFGAAVRTPAGPEGALCVGFAVSPAREERHLMLWTIERYASLAALCLLQTDLLAGLLADVDS